MVLNTQHIGNLALMKKEKVYIGGFVEAPLKQRFMKEFRKMAQKNGQSASNNPKTTQSQFMQLLLAESIAVRKKRMKRAG